MSCTPHELSGEARDVYRQIEAIAGPVVGEGECLFAAWLAECICDVWDLIRNERFARNRKQVWRCRYAALKKAIIAGKGTAGISSDDVCVLCEAIQ